LSKQIESLLDDTDLGGSEDAVANFPSSAHYDSNMITFIFTLRFWHSEDGLVKQRVKLFANRVVLF